MKRTAIIVGILSLAVWAAAQSTGSTQQTPPPAGQTPPTQGTAAQGTPAPLSLIHI